MKMFGGTPKPQIAGVGRVVRGTKPEKMGSDYRAIGRVETRRHAAVSARRQRFPSQRLNGLARWAIFGGATNDFFSRPAHVLSLSGAFYLRPDHLT